MPTLAGFSVFAIILVLFVIITLMMGIRQVPQGYNYTVERFGRYNKTLTPGLGVIIPYFDRIGRKLNVMEQVIDVPSQEIITKDNATVKVDGVAFYQVLDVRRASYEVSNLEQALLNLVMTNIRTVMGSMDLDQLLSHRDSINERLLTVVDSAASPWATSAAFTSAANSWPRAINAAFSSPEAWATRLPWLFCSERRSSKRTADDRRSSSAASTWSTKVGSSPRARWEARARSGSSRSTRRSITE